jgi:hypothetical protein
LLHERYVKAAFVYTPAPWFPLLDASLEAGRLADTAAQDVRPGLRASVSGKLRPLPALELEPSLRQAVLRQDGVNHYRESAQQWLAVWHFDARHSLRAIAQRASLRRLPEGTVTAYSESSQTGSLTYAWRRSAGTRLFVGAARSKADMPANQRRSEVFVKLQFDVAEAAGGW